MKTKRILIGMVCTLLLFAFLPFSSWYQVANDIASAQTAAEAVIGSGTGSGSSENEEVSSEAPYTPGSGYLQYLSDYSTSEMVQCTVGWGTYTRDKNLDGKKIKLKIDGTAQEFDKGVTAHANATLIYDLGENHAKFDYFQSWIGLDNYRGNNGNVKFQFFVSNDKTNWTELTAADNMIGETEFRNAFVSGNANAIQVKFDEVKTNRYLKIYIDKNGADTADHATLADAKLASDEEYKAPVVTFLKDASYYSAKLAGKSYSEIMSDENLEMALLQYRFMTLYGKDNLQTFLTSSMNYVNRINAFWWLFNDYDALKEFLNGGEPIGDNYLGALNVLSDLYAEYKDDLKDNQVLRKPDSQHTGETRSNLYRRMMLSMSLCCANGWNAWLARAGTCNPVNRYAYFKENYVSWKMRDEIFENLSVDELRWVVGNNISDAEIVWLNDYARAHPRGGNQTWYPILYSPHHHIAYRWYNYDKDQYYAAENETTYRTKYMLDEKYEKYGLSYGYNADGSKTPQRLWMVFADGAVCGNISRTGANLAACFGVAACEVGQPGHAAFCIMNRKSTTDERMIWGIDNDISGWAQSSNSRRMPCDWGDDTQSWATGWKAQYCIIAQAALNDPDNYAKAEEIMMAADLAVTVQEKEACYQAALSYLPYHLDAWVALINLYNDTNSGKTAQDIVALADQLCSKESQVCYYPKALQDLKNLLLNGLNTRLSAAADEEAKLDIQEKISYINNIAFQTGLQTALKATDQDCAQPDYAINTAKSMLNSADYTLATFSFDGDNANKLVFNSSFSSVRYRYSLDGGTTWTESDTKYKEEGQNNVTVALDGSKITAENDIYVWLDGWAGSPDISKAFKIDIQAGQDVSGIEFNDKENRFIGDVTSMEYQLDGGAWQTLTNDVIPGISGEYAAVNHTIVVHKKASGTTLQGKDKTYTATNNDSADRTYIPISQISLAGYSSEQTNQGDYAKYAIDGLAATRWHTAWNGSDKQNYIILKTNEAKYFSGIDYLPPPASKGQNGIIYAGNVYVSTDGQHWILAGTFKWNDDFKEKQITFSQSVYGQYVKLVATGCHGGFAGGSKIELFEDTTLVNKEILGISLLTLPTKLEYIQGETLDLTGATAKLVYTDNSYSLLPVEMLTADKTVFNETGAQQVTLSYGQHSASFHVTVDAREGFTPTGITIAKEPDKLVYYAGDTLDTTGMQVTATDGIQTVYLNADEYTVEADLSAENAECPVTVTLKSNTALTQTFNVAVKRAIKSIAVTKLPDKTAYELGDALDTTGLEVTAYYNIDKTDSFVLEADQYVIENASTFSEEDGDVEIEIQLADKTSIQTSYKVTVYGYFTKDGVYYAVNKADHTCTVMEIRPENQESFISIPDSIQVGTKVYTVTSIGTNVMGSADSVTAIALPGTINNIDGEAFRQSRNLKQIFFTAHTSFDGLKVGSNAFNTDIEIVFYAANQTLEENLKKQDFAENLSVSNVSALITGIKVTPPVSTTVANGQKPDYTGLKVQAVLEEASGEKIVPIELKTCTINPTADQMDTNITGDKSEVKEVTVSLTANSQTFTDKFTITVEKSKLHITQHPANAVYVSLTEKITPLTVKAESDQSTDVLTYQWYCSESGTLNYTNDKLEGETEQTCTPTKNGFYYCQVTKEGTNISVYSLPAEISIGDYVAIVNNKGYDSLAEAVNSATADATITLLKDTTLSAGITINKNLTINGGKHTVTRGYGYTGSMFNVTSGKLTINELIIDGGADWYYTEKTSAGGYSAALKRGWKYKGTQAKGTMIRASGSANIELNKSTLQNNYNMGSDTASTGGAIFAENSAVINLTDTNVMNNYSDVFGSAIYHRDNTTLTINGNCLFQGNSGGSKWNTSVICVDVNGKCTVNGGTFCYNAGKEKGGIFWVSNGSLTLNGGTFENNLTETAQGQAITKGRLLYLNGSAKVTVNVIDKIDSDEEIYLTQGRTITIGKNLASGINLVIQTADQTSGTNVAVLDSGVNDRAAVQNAVKVNTKTPGIKVSDTSAALIIPCSSNHMESTDQRVLQTATCTQKGISYTYCTVCGAIMNKTETACTGHTEVAVQAQAADCYNEGHTAGTQCSDCGKILSGIETIPKIEHEYTITCTKEAKCEEAGEIQYTCKHCGHTYTESVNQLGHDMYISSTIPATTTCTGTEIHSCSRCDWQYSVELPKLDAKGLQIQLPTQTTFVITQSFTKPSDGTVGIIGSDDKVYDVVSLSDPSVTVTGPSESEWQIGTKQVTVSYKGATTTYDIYIVKQAVESVETFTAPTNTKYIAGKSTELDLSGGKWAGKYNDGTGWNNALELAQISGTYDLNKAGKYELTATFTEGDVSKTEKFTIQVLDPEVTAIALKGTDKIEKKYVADTGKVHALDVSGLSLEIELNGFVTETITNLTPSNFSGFSDNPENFVQNADGTISAITQDISLISVPGYDKIASNVGMPSYDISWMVEPTNHLEIEGLSPSTVIVGNAFVPTAGTVGVVYTNGQVFDKAVIPDNHDVTTNVDTSSVANDVEGTLSYTLSEYTRTGSFKINVIAQAISSAVFVAPTKTNYIQDQTAPLDLQGGYWDVTYNDNSTAQLPLELASASGYDFTHMGEQTVSFTSPIPNTDPGTFNINVEAKKVSQMEWMTMPTVTEYVRGRDQVLDVSGGKIKVTFNNGQDAVAADLESSWCTGFDNEAKIGSHKILVFKFEDYQLEDSASDLTWQINFVQRVKSIAVTTAPKTVYVENQTFDPTGGKVSISFYDETKIIDLSSNQLTLSPDQNTRLQTGDTAVTISYKDADQTVFSTTQSITVNKKKIIGAELIAPTKDSYYQDSDEQLDVTGGYWKVTYDNGEKETDITKYPLTAESCTGFDLSDATEKLPIAVSQILDGSFVAVGAFNIEVAAKEIKTVNSFTAPTNDTYYLAGKSKSLDLTGGKWQVTYNNGKREEIALTAEELSDLPDFSKAGTYTVRAKLKDREETFTIEVHTPEITAVTLNGTDSVKKSYISESSTGHTLDVTGLSLNVTYNGVLTEENVTGLTAENFEGFSDNPRTFVQGENGIIPAITQTITLKSVPGGAKIASGVTMPGYTISWQIAVTNEIEITGLEPASVVVNNAFVPSSGTVGVVYSNGQVFDLQLIKDNPRVTTEVDTTKVSDEKTRQTTGVLKYTLGNTTRSGEFKINVLANELESAVFIAPTSADDLYYVQDQEGELTANSGRWDCTYTDGTQKSIPLTLPLNLQINKHFPSVGDYSVTVPSPKAGDPSQSYIIHIVEKQVEKMEWLSKPSVTEYVCGKDQMLDVTGGRVKITFNNGQNAIETDLDSSWCTGFDASTSSGSKQTITVDGYGDYTFEAGAAKPEWTIQFVNKVESIAVITPPSKTSYIEGETFDPEGGKISVTYYDGTTKEIPLSSNALTLSPDKNTALKTDDTAVSITYKDTDGTEFVTTQAIAVRKKKIVSAELVAPTNVSYYQDSGEQLDVNGGYWKVTYDNGQAETDPGKYPLVAENCSGFDLSTAVKQQEIRVSQILGDTYPASGVFDIEVIAKAITKSELITPTKTTYDSDDTDLDLSGGSFKVELNNGKTEIFDLTNASYINCSAPNFHQIGDQDIQVTYSKDGLTAEKTFKIHIEIVVHDFWIGDNDVINPDHAEQKETTIAKDDASEAVLYNVVCEAVAKFENNHIQEALEALSQQTAGVEVTLKQCKVVSEVNTRISVDSAKTQKNDKNEIIAMTLDIHPEANVRLEQQDTKASVLIGGKAIDITSTNQQPLSMSVALPDSFKVSADNKAYIDHKVNGYYREYVGKVTEENGIRMVNFINTDGFSEFTIYAESHAVAVIGNNRYANAQDALDALRADQTLELLQDISGDLSSKPVGFWFNLIRNGHTFTYKVAAGCELSMEEKTDGTLVLTIVKKGSNDSGTTSLTGVSPDTGITSGSKLAVVIGIAALALVILVVWLYRRNNRH